ncbi:MAG: hypothetical protein U1F43_22205 [Myxococcota bacterium]
MKVAWIAIALVVTLGVGCGSAPLAPPPAARVDELAGRDAAAWQGWLAEARRAREVALVHLLGLVDRVALGPADLEAARALPELAELVAARLGDQAALDDARARLGAVYTARVDRGGDVPIRAGWIAVPDGPGPHTVVIAPALVGPAAIEIRGDAAFAVRVGGRPLVERDPRRALQPTVVRLSATLTDAAPLVLELPVGGVRLRVLVRPQPAPSAADADAPAPVSPLDALDLAIADGDVALADRLSRALERRGAWAALASDADERFAAADPTHPPESLDVPERAAPGLEVTTSCAARARWLGDDGEALRYRPGEIAAAALQLPALLGPCATAALQAGDMLVDTFQLDAAERLARRLAEALDPGPETERARALLERIERARGRAATPAPRALELGLPLVDAAPLVARAELGPGQTVLWDDRFVEVRVDGQTVRSHVVACAGDEAATEALGELEVPDDAEVILARTWRREPDGTPPRALEPEDIAEKATISLPALLPGDCAEWAWYREVPADPRLPPGGFVLAPFALQRADARVVHARFTLRMGPGVTSSFPPSFSIGPLLTAARPDPRTWVFEARDLAPRVAEPLDPRPELRLAHVSAWGGFELPRWLERLRDEVAPGLVASPRLARLAASAAAAEAPRDRLMALLHAVVDGVEQSSENVSAARASWAVARARGERAVVLAAACQAVGLECDLMLARPLSEVGEPGVPDPEAFAYPLVRARLPHETLWLDPSNAFMPAGLLPPLLQGVPALALSGPLPATPTGLDETPRPPALDNGRRTVVIAATLAPDGTFAVTGKERVDGVYAATWRGALAQLTPEAQRRLLSAIVLQAFPDAHVDDLTIDGLGARDVPLTWSWSAHVTTEPAGGKARALKLGLLPEGLGRGTVLVPERSAPLLVNRASTLDLSVTLELPPGWLFLRTPTAEAKVTHPSVHLVRTARVEQDVQRAATPARLTIQKTFALAPTVVAPEGYPAWKEAALEVDRADYLQIVVTPLPPSP